MLKGSVHVEYTVGDGNRIFQYIFARLLSHIHGLELSSDSLKVLGVEKSAKKFNPQLPITHIDFDERDFNQYLDKDRSPSNYLVYTHPEDYTIYKDYLDLIRGWFQDVPITHKDDLVMHLRLGDRLIYRNEYCKDALTSLEEYIEAIKLFDYKRLYIVTDMPKWSQVKPEDLIKMKFHVSVPSSMRADLKIASNYFNSLVNGFSVLNPIVRVGNSVKDDFNFMRSFGQILFKHGTLAWWAAALSHASRVGVYGPWRPNKGGNNKNLGQTDFAGWFRWGN